MNHPLPKIKKGELMPITGSSLVGSVIVILFFIASATTFILELNWSLAFEWLNLLLILLYLVLPAFTLYIICFRIWSKEKQRDSSSYYISKSGKLKVNLWKELGWLLSLSLIFLILLFLSELAWIDKSNKEAQKDTPIEIKSSKETLLDK